MIEISVCLADGLQTLGFGVCVCVHTPVNAHLFCSHGLKHLLQKDSHLLDVVHQHARLEEDKSGRQRL